MFKALRRWSCGVATSTVHRHGEGPSRRDFAFMCDPLCGNGVWQEPNGSRAVVLFALLTTLVRHIWLQLRGIP